MSYKVSYDGIIDIDPPLTYTELKQKLPKDKAFPNRPAYSLLEIAETGVDPYPLYVRIDEKRVDDPDGVFIKMTGIRIEPVMPDYEASDKAQLFLSKIAEMFPDHMFGGYIECTGEDGKLWRLRIDDGEVRRIDPQIVWPE